MSLADTVITHAGAGSVMEALGKYSIKKISGRISPKSQSFFSKTSRCDEVENFAETHFCKLGVILVPRVLYGCTYTVRVTSMKAVGSASPSGEELAKGPVAHRTLR